MVERLGHAFMLHTVGRPRSLIQQLPQPKQPPVPLLSATVPVGLELLLEFGVVLFLCSCVLLRAVALRRRGSLRMRTRAELLLYLDALLVSGTAGGFLGGPLHRIHGKEGRAQLFLIPALGFVRQTKTTRKIIGTVVGCE